jgi:hypothetical protein
MKPIETTYLTPEQIKLLSDEQKKELPTILDVVEYLASLENDNMRRNLQKEGMRDLYREGKYAILSDQAWTNIPKLYPCSQTTFTLMRGESSYHSDSHPSLFRPQKKMSKEDFIVISRLRAAEFIAIMKKHRVVQELAQICEIEYMAIAQHYGFATEYMDITNEKWVAAFFACTKYQNSNYVPYVPSDKPEIGVLYIGEQSNQQTYPVNVRALGFHYFERPTRQNALVYHMKESDNFDANSFFKRIVFRHDKAASDFVFKMSYNQMRYFPNDDWSLIAEKILQSDYPLSQSAIDESRNYGILQSDEEIMDILHRNNVPFSASSTPHAMPSPQLLDEEYRIWRTYVLPHLDRNILQFSPVFKI